VSVSLTLGHLLCTRDMAGLLSMLLYSCASITLGRMHWESMYILIFMDNYGCAGHLEMVFLIFSYLFSSLTVLAALLRSLCWAVSHIFGIWFCNFGLPLNLSDVHSGQQRFSYREPLQNTIKFDLCWCLFYEFIVHVFKLPDYNFQWEGLHPSLMFLLS
jgi:hypothetical protein